MAIATIDAGSFSRDKKAHAERCWRRQGQRSNIVRRGSTLTQLLLEIAKRVQDGHRAPKKSPNHDCQSR